MSSLNSTTNTPATIEELEVQVAAAQSANAINIANAAKIVKLKAKLALESSESLFNAKVDLAVISGNTETLKSMVNACIAIVENNPVHNKNTRKNRVWAGQKRFEFGNQVNLMFQIASGIVYSCAEHKALMLAYTELGMEMLEQFVNAFGSTAYYSTKEHELIEAVPYVIEEVHSTIAVMQSAMNVVVDTSLLTLSKFSIVFGKGQSKALKDLAKAQKAIEGMEDEMAL